MLEPKNEFPKLRFIKGVGEAREKILNALGIFSVENLILYFPYRYYDRSTVIPIAEAYRLIQYDFQDEVTFIGKIKSVRKIPTNRRQILEITFSDKTALIKVLFFEGINIFQRIFQPDLIVAFSGKLSKGKNNEPVLIHPSFDIIKDKDELNLQNTGRIVPQYSLRGISQAKSASFGPHVLRKIIRNALNQFLPKVTETLPEYILKEFKLLNLRRTIKNLHQPESKELLEQAQNRMKFEEIFYFQMLAALSRQSIKQFDESIQYKTVGEKTKKFIRNNLPFELTEDQKKVIKEIFTDFKSGYPMNRLLQGDVGSGKTLVALITALISVDNGFQVALMVPTEILAFQHYQYFVKLLREIPINICLLTSSTPASVRKKYLSMIENGEMNIIIGTHALIEENVQFKNLGYVIIDEQHRFGVLQRAQLKMKGHNPHLLVMTATPIPRTLALTIYSDLDLSIIKTMPANRKPIKTYLIHESKRPDLYNFIRKEILNGNQAYIIYPLIEESEKIDLEDVISNYNRLKNEVFPDLNVGMIHGKLTAAEKEEIMTRFNSGEINILVATSVIEVGIDNPNATIMVIEEAQRFGLSQLHQLRGRVGRGEKQSYCILVSNIHVEKENHKMFIKDAQKHIAYERLKAMINYNDGFKIAEIDFKLRGPGDIFGVRQSGIPEFRFVNVFEDYDLIEKVRQLTFRIVDKDPNLENDVHKIIKKVIQDRYSNQKLFSSIA